MKGNEEIVTKSNEAYEKIGGLLEQVVILMEEANFEQRQVGRVVEEANLKLEFIQKS